MDFLFEVKRIFVDIFFNIITATANIFIKRDKKIILFGGRYGNRFAGNTRFLFQYCFANKDELGFKKVIWATRKKSIKEELEEMGYDVVLIRSCKGIYWHLKAGIHIICGAPTPQKSNGVVRLPDISAVLSLGATTFNLWHCAFLPKATPRDGNTAMTSKLQNTLTIIFNYLNCNAFLRKFVLYPGGWGNCIFLLQNYNFTLGMRSYTRYCLAGMSELCQCLKYTKYERAVLQKFSSSNKKIILFTPTWRNKAETPYRSPLGNSKFRDFLKEKNYFWVEKLHPAASKKMESDIYYSEISMLLHDDIDLNAICQHVDMMITDYSSTYQKAIWFYKPFSFYTPDKDYYIEKDMGLNDTFINFVKDGFCQDINSLMSDIEYKMQDGYIESMKNKYDEWRNMYFNVEATNYETICKRMFDPELIK